MFRPELPPNEPTLVSRCCPTECVEEKEQLRARVKELERQIGEYKKAKNYLIRRILALKEAHHGAQ